MQVLCNFLLDTCVTINYPSAVNEAYKAALEEAVKELANAVSERKRLELEREALDRKIKELRDGVVGVGSLCGMDRSSIIDQYPELFSHLTDPDMGLTEAIRRVLKSREDLVGHLGRRPNESFLTPIQIREQLQSINYDLSNHQNILASLHTILKRLTDQQKVVTTTIDGKTAYRWKVLNPQDRQREAKRKRGKSETTRK